MATRCLGWWSARALLFGLAAIGSTSCSSSEGDEPASDEPCLPPNRLVADDRCVAPGVQDSGCPAGELGLADGSCQPAGVPPELCGEGFEPVGAGCEPLLPPEPCPAGLMAVPGESTCREVAPCGSGRWGDIPVDATTEHVDGSYGGGASDGTVARPWTSIGEAVAAAAPGAIVAIAEGSYPEDLALEGKAVRLWGRCPASVEVVGSAAAQAAVEVGPGASGTEVRSLAIRGGAIGLVASGAQDVVLEQLWVHETAQHGVLVSSVSGPTAVSLVGTLVEQAHHVGVAVEGADVIVEDTVVRGTLPRPADQAYGRGMGIEHDQGTSQPANVEVHSSVIEHNHECGLCTTGSHVTIEGTVVRHTQPQASDRDYGWGIGSRSNPDASERASFTLRSSFVAENHSTGLYVGGTDALLEGTVVRGTLPRESDQAFGRGINVTPSFTTSHRATVVLRQSLVEHNYDMGVSVSGTDATIEATIVRDTLPEAWNQRDGRGINLTQDDLTFERSSMVLRASLVDGSHEGGVVTLGSDAIVEGTVVRGTLPQALDSLLGHGMHIQHHLVTTERSTVVLRASVVEQNREFGVLVTSSDATIQDSVVRDTTAGAADGQFGDGVTILAIMGVTSPASAAISSSLIATNERAGIALFSASATLGNSTLECNTIQLDQESFGNDASTLEDLGGNDCGCGAEREACQVLSTGLEAPRPPGPG